MSDDRSGSTASFGECIRSREQSGSAATVVVGDMSDTQPTTDPRVADLVQAGRVRVALYVPQYTKDPITGALSGWTIDLVSALGARLGVEGVPVEHPTPPDAMASLKAGVRDAAILGIEPSRAVDVDYTPAVVQADYTLLVPVSSSIRSITEADHPGIRIAAVRNHASTMTLARMLRPRATLPRSGPV
jgi:polar amino acid transport system substrate-binding protein